MLEQKLTDIHTHILPMVDDGSSSYELSDAMLEAQLQEGVHCIYLTPHLRKSMFEVDNDAIIEAFERYCEHVEVLGLPVTLRLGREYFADSFFMTLLEEDDVIPLGDTRCVLVEFSRSHNFKYIRNYCYQVLQKGYTPIIAHAERYPVFVEHREYVQQLVHLGAHIQVNAASILGQDGWKCKQFCRYLMKKNLIAFVSSDCHNMTNRIPNLGKCMKYIEKKMGAAYMHELAYQKPAQILVNR